MTDMTEIVYYRSSMCGLQYVVPGYMTAASQRVTACVIYLVSFLTFECWNITVTAGATCGQDMPTHPEHLILLPIFLLEFIHIVHFLVFCVLYSILCLS